MTQAPASKWSVRGVEMPVVGFGTSYLETCSESVAAAIRVGYRLLDTARKYGTEEGVGAGMLCMAYAPIRHKDLSTKPVIGEIARKWGKSYAQITLRWHIQQGNVSPIPSSDSAQHIAENMDFFDFTLTDDEMKRMSALKRSDGRTSNIEGYAPEWDLVSGGGRV